jgi:hypothetical protein
LFLFLLGVACLFSLTGCESKQPPEEAPAPAALAGQQPSSSDSLRYENEIHLRNIRQLTFGGNNAEAYWSPDGNYRPLYRSDCHPWTYALW